MRHDAHIKEVRITAQTLKEFNDGRLSRDALEEIASRRSVRPTKLHEYISACSKDEDARIKELYPLTLPLGLVDDRIMDLALKFDEDPDASMLKGYRRLESAIKKRAGIDKKRAGIDKKRAGIDELSGKQLFGRAFFGDDSLLHWKGCARSTQEGRASLFSAVFMGYRNQRAHEEGSQSRQAYVREFLLLNELFVLESMAVVRRKKPKPVVVEQGPV